jgi:hypothetical protein
MPRNIIDTESSRPAYVRRNVTRTITVVIIVIALAVVLFETLRRAHAPA